MRVYPGIQFKSIEEKNKLPTIYVCKDCGDEIERATREQIPQDRCFYCFKKLYRKYKQLKMCFMLED